METEEKTEIQKKFENLRHVRKPLPGNGQVVVLDTGALIDAEENAMLQALHSRSLGGIDAHLMKLATKGARDFMQMYYVGYGDKSIGDDGTTTVFVEGISMLAAKAIQDSQLYNGQESSTRYIDFSKQPFANPTGTDTGGTVLESLRTFYLEGLATMKKVLAERHPRQENEEEKIWQKAINARAFDIMRSFLPAGAATNLAWHTELRHAVDHLLRLRHHPLPEVRMIAETIASALNEKYPNSGFAKRYEATENYVETWMRDAYYFDYKHENPLSPKAELDGIVLERNTIDPAFLREHRNLLLNRPPKTELPKFIAEAGTMQFLFRILPRFAAAPVAHTAHAPAHRPTRFWRVVLRADARGSCATRLGLSCKLQQCNGKARPLTYARSVLYSDGLRCCVPHHRRSASSCVCCGATLRRNSPPDAPHYCAGYGVTYARRTRKRGAYTPYRREPRSFQLQARDSRYCGERKNPRIAGIFSLSFEIISRPRPLSEQSLKRF
jgi:thymidylate synthase ThyX